MIDALGVTSPRSYKNVPFYVSTRGYGVFFNHSSLMTYWVGSRSACDVQVAAQDDFLDYSRAGEQHTLEVTGSDVPVRLWDKVAAQVRVIIA